MLKAQGLSMLNAQCPRLNEMPKMLDAQPLVLNPSIIHWALSIGQ
jgi:hypothetical protein